MYEEMNNLIPYSLYINCNYICQEMNDLPNSCKGFLFIPDPPPVLTQLLGENLH